MLKRWFVECTPFGKACAVVLIGVGMGATAEAGRRVLHGPAPEELRRRLERCILDQEYLEARTLLGQLETACGGLSDSERQELAGPVAAGLGRMRLDLRAEIDEHRRAHRWDAALASLEVLDKAELDPEWTSFVRAEVLVSAGRWRDAAKGFAAFATQHPDARRRDEALQRRALVLDALGDRAAAQAARDEMQRMSARASCEEAR